jgi:acetolactate synthase I/II/III large subunit
MNGAESLLQTLLAGGVDTCFMNPGTSEIHFVAALDSAPRMRAVPCLFEGVASGAADGYARMRGKPSSILLHLGPGLSNALANLHNACRARVPLITIVGDHAGFHRDYETPLASDISALAKPYSGWLRSAASAENVGLDCADAIAAARAGNCIATLILPADAAWGKGGKPVRVSIPAPLPLADNKQIEDAAALLRNGLPTALVLGQGLTSGAALVHAGKIAARSGAQLLAPFAFTRIERGAGRPPVARIPYVTGQAVNQLSKFSQFILVDAPPPVSFFAHPQRPSVLTPPEARILALAKRGQDSAGTLAALADVLGAQNEHLQTSPANRPECPHGPITLEGLAAAVAATLPEQAIVVDESITSGRNMMAATAGAPPHDWLVNTGGSIGIGMPLAVGASVACPERPVLCLEADGSGMYTLQALWTMARENLPITTVIFSNRAYAILKGELSSLDINPGRRALDVLDIDRPALDWIALAKGMGVCAQRISTLEEFARALCDGFSSRAPNLVEVLL